VLSVVVGVTVVWTGLGAAFYTDRPAGFWITTIGFAMYVAARTVRWGAAARWRHRP